MIIYSLKKSSYLWSLHKQFRHQILLTHDLLHIILLNGYLIIYTSKGYRLLMHHEVHG
jgi:hypothetical protein